MSGIDHSSNAGIFSQAQVLNSKKDFDDISGMMIWQYSSFDKFKDKHQIKCQKRGQICDASGAKVDALNKTKSQQQIAGLHVKKALAAGRKSVN